MQSTATHGSRRQQEKQRAAAAAVAKPNIYLIPHSPDRNIGFGLADAAESALWHSDTVVTIQLAATRTKHAAYERRDVLLRGRGKHQGKHQQCEMLV